MRSLYTCIICVLVTCSVSLAQQNHTIVTQGLTFSPSFLIVQLGDTVTWMNSGGGSHNVNGSTSNFPSNPVGFFSGAPSSANWTFRHVFSTLGTYNYICDPHASLGMTGVIAVQTPSLPTPLLVITEIMYNNPGVDDYEYIEIYNNDVVPVDMTGYTMTGVNYTFPEVIVAPGAYLMLAIDSVLFEAAFGVPALQWTSGGVNNSGELIAISDAEGNVVDSVRYSTTAPWPASANGMGPSLQLCDVAADNGDAANWAASTTPTGFFINGVELRGTPGADNDCAPPPAPTYPAYTIGQVTTNDLNGIPDSIGITCELQGVVYGINARPTGLQFTIIDDQNDGIAVFNGVDDYGYTVSEGDLVTVRGTIAQFNGLTQMVLDTAWFVSAGNSLFAPAVVSLLGEGTESQLVRINNLTLVDPAQWTNMGNGFNVDVTDGTNTYLMRIISATNIFGTNPPTQPFNLTGLGGQFDNTSPFDEGYQLLPRYLADIDVIVSTQSPALAQAVRLFPNPVTNQMTVHCTVAADLLVIRNALGQVVSSTARPNGVFHINTSAWASGLYIATLTSGNETYSVKLVK